MNIYTYVYREANSSAAEIGGSKRLTELQTIPVYLILPPSRPILTTASVCEGSKEAFVQLRGVVFDASNT